MSKLLFAGSRLDCFTQVYGSPGETTGGIDNAYSDAGVNVRNGGIQGQLWDPAAAPLLSPYSVEAGASFYFHSWLSQSGNAAYVILLDNAGVAWFQLTGSGQMQYNSGTAEAPVWTNVGGNYGGAPSNTSLDIKLDLAEDGTHTVLLAYAGVGVVGPVTFTQPLFTNVSRFQLMSLNDGYQDVIWSQVLCTENLSTINAHVATSRGTAAGNYQEWAGNVSDVNEVITSDASYNQAVTAGLRQTYDMSNITVPAGYEILGAFHYFRVKNDGTSPENVSSKVIVDASEYDSGNVTPAPLVTFAGTGARYDANPHTSEPWTQADWNAPVQLGFTSEA